MRHVVKVGLAVLDSDRILLVRKHGSPYLILPGGKPESGEDDVTALHREIDEELGCRVGGASLLGVFSDKLAGADEDRVEVRLYAGTLEGIPLPRSEIAELIWVELSAQDRPDLAPSLRNSIMPFVLAASIDAGQKPKETSAS